jgi:hypothetical protein
MAVFQVVAPCSLVAVYQHFRGTCWLHQGNDDGGSKCLWNIDILLPDYTALQPRRQPYSKVIVVQPVHKFSAFQEARCALHCSQKPATGHYSETVESKPHAHILLHFKQTDKNHFVFIRLISFTNRRNLNAPLRNSNLWNWIPRNYCKSKHTFF